MTNSPVCDQRMILEFLSAFYSNLLVFLGMCFKKYWTLFLLVVLIGIRDQVNGFLRRSGFEEDLCMLCENRTSGFLQNHCGSKKLGRCCLDSKNVTIGLDLGNCGLKRVMSLSKLANIKWLNLASNSFSITKCNSSKFFSDSFEGLIKLEKVYLKDSCTCPGGSVLWNHTKSIGNETKICNGQLSTCQYLNETCPSHSFCSSYGPGFYECKCYAQWMGYKCLVKGGIPLALFLGAITGGMLLLTLVIFFLQLKRKRMYSQGYFWIDGTATRGSMHS